MPLIRKRVVLLRKFTERPEAVEAGFVEVVGTVEEDIRKYGFMMRRSSHVTS